MYSLKPWHLVDFKLRSEQKSLTTKPSWYLKSSSPSRQIWQATARQPPRHLVREWFMAQLDRGSRFVASPVKGYKNSAMMAIRPRHSSKSRVSHMCFLVDCKSVFLRHYFARASIWKTSDAGEINTKPVTNLTEPNHSLLVRKARKRTNKRDPADRDEQTRTMTPISEGNFGSVFTS